MFERLKSLWRRRPSLEQLSILLVIAQQVTATVERPGKSGPAKKAEALDMVGGLVNQLGLPVPPALVDLAIEAAARQLPRGGK